MADGDGVELAGWICVALVADAALAVVVGALIGAGTRATTTPLAVRPASGSSLPKGFSTATVDRAMMGTPLNRGFTAKAVAAVAYPENLPYDHVNRQRLGEGRR